MLKILLGSVIAASLCAAPPSPQHRQSRHVYEVEGAAVVLDSGLRTNAVPSEVVEPISIIFEGEYVNTELIGVLIVGFDGQVLTIEPGGVVDVVKGPSPYGVTCLCECGSGSIAVHPGNDQGNNCSQFNDMSCLDPNDSSVKTTKSCKKGLGPVTATE